MTIPSCGYFVSAKAYHQIGGLSKLLVTARMHQAAGALPNPK
jgi:hypothetical protein